MTEGLKTHPRTTSRSEDYRNWLCPKCGDALYKTYAEEVDGRGGKYPVVVALCPTCYWKRTYDLRDA